MNNTDEFETDEEDISALEDSPLEDEPNVITGAGVGIESITPDTPVYRLRLIYSHETFFAIYRDGVLSPRSKVIVPTRYGKDLAEVIDQAGGKTRPASEIARIERPAEKDDLERARRNRELEREAFKICKEKIASRRLEMKLVLAHYLLEEPKILFFYTAENRVDFRELVKDLAGIFKHQTRVELRQIGVRDEARVVGGLGICGRAYCCHAVSDKLRPVSIKMAKDQKLSLNSMKISGTCGRLLCCLSYEYGFYSEQQRFAPPEGIHINYNGESWKVHEVNLITGQVRLAADDGRQVTEPLSRFERADNRWRIK